MYLVVNGKIHFIGLEEYFLSLEILSELLRYAEAMQEINDLRSKDYLLTCLNKSTVHFLE